MLTFFSPSSTWRPHNTIPLREEYANKELRWCGGDTEKNYKKQGNHSYKPGDFTYKFNSLGYRCPEFEVSGPKLLSIGCSTIFGTGLPQEELQCEIVAQKLGATNLNLGMPGASNDYISRMLHIAVPALNPDYVIVNFTYVSRREFLTPSGQLITYHPGMVERGSHSSEVRAYCRMLRDITNANENLSNLYKNFCLVSKILEGRKWVFSAVHNKFPKMLSGLFDEKRYVGIMTAQGPKARDGVHAGKEANAAQALTYLRGLETIPNSL